MIIINFKNYEESTGDGAKVLAEIFEKVSVETSGDIAVAVHPTDLRSVAEIVNKLWLFSQGADFYSRNPDGTHKKTQTGRMTPDLMKKIGVDGILVNHAENPCSNEEIKMIVEDFRAECPMMKIIVCAESVDRAEQILAVCGGGVADDGVVGLVVRPDFIAIEPPEMIGGDVSVTTKPEIIVEAVSRIGVDVLVGAGVKTSADVKEALNLGAKGVLLASGVIKPKDGKTPEQALRELI